MLTPYQNGRDQSSFAKDNGIVEGISYDEKCNSQHHSEQLTHKNVIVNTQVLEADEWEMYYFVNPKHKG